MLQVPVSVIAHLLQDSMCCVFLLTTVIQSDYYLSHLKSELIIKAFQLTAHTVLLQIVLFIHIKLYNKAHLVTALHSICYSCIKIHIWSYSLDQPF